MANRVVTIDTIWADGAADVPVTPVEGTTYRNSIVSQADIEEALPFATRGESSRVNEILYRISAMMQQIEQYGILPWCEDTVYKSGAICVGSDNEFYRSLSASTAEDPVSSPTVWTYAFSRIGDIKIWSGSVATIQAGWQLCDGTNGTPNLRDRFIVGAGSTYNPGNTGGTKDAIVVSHNHSVSISDPGHIHSTLQAALSTDATAGYNSVRMSAASGSVLGMPSSYAPSGTTGISGSCATTGSSGTNQNLPPYYALAYIMRIS